MCFVQRQAAMRLRDKRVLTVLYFAGELLLSEVPHVAHWVHCFYHLFCIQTYSSSVMLCQVLNESANKGATVHIYFLFPFFTPSSLHILQLLPRAKKPANQASPLLRRKSDDWLITYKSLTTASWNCLYGSKVLFLTTLRTLPAFKLIKGSRPMRLLLLGDAGVSWSAN